jgi:hypothetical protein
VACIWFTLGVVLMGHGLGGLGWLLALVFALTIGAVAYRPDLMA